MLFYSKHLYLSVIFLFISCSLRSQALPENVYLVHIPVADSTNIGTITNMLLHYSNPSTITYDDANKMFTIKTMLKLDKNVISGKLQKNFFPVSSFEKIIDPMPRMVNTGDQEQDAIDYEKRKEKWIKENPQEYKLMNNNPEKR
jgi:hypothetical protein